MPAPKFVPVGPRTSYGAAGHVFASVIADTFDDCCGSRVADGKAFARAADGEQRTSGCTIKRHVADDDLCGFGPRQLAARANHQLASGKTFADEVVGLAFEHQLHAAAGEGAKRLACGAAKRK